MKVSASVVIFASSAIASDIYKAPKGHDENGNKINGQHPKRRLQALNKFMCNWAVEYLDDGKAGRICERYTDMIYRLENSFERETCSYFNPEVKFGGPNPDENMSGKVPAKNPNAKNPTRARRLRRNAAEEDYEACDGLTEAECDAATLDGLDCDEDDQNDADMDAVCKSGVVRGSLTSADRKLKRYSIGLAKWCKRYVSECYGQRTYQHCINRAANFIETLSGQN